MRAQRDSALRIDKWNPAKDTSIVRHHEMHDYWTSRGEHSGCSKPNHGFAEAAVGLPSPEPQCNSLRNDNAKYRDSI